MSELPEGFGADKISLALKQQANEREQIALLTKENDELRARLEILKANDTAWESSFLNLKREHDDALALLGAYKMDRDEVKARAERAEAAVVEWENREASVCPENVPFEHVIKALRTEKERAEAAVAEMRSMIPELWRCANDDCDLSQANINDALSTQCGVGWLSPEKAGRLREALKEIQGHPDAAHTTIIEIATNALAETGGEK